MKKISILTRFRQWLTRVTDTRRRAVYIAPCAGCGELPISTFLRQLSDEPLAHLTCANPACLSPRWTSTHAARRTLDEAVAEWNGLNRPRDVSVGFALFARAGQVDDELNVWTDEAMRAIAEKRPDAFIYVFNQREGVGELFIMSEIKQVMDADDEADLLDDTTPLARSSRTAFQKRRAEPPQSTRSVGFRHSRDDFSKPADRDDEEG